MSLYICSAFAAWSLGSFLASSIRFAFSSTAMLGGGEAVSEGRGEVEVAWIWRGGVQKVERVV